MSKAVLDASAILAVIHDERGWERVVPHLEGALVSAVNYSEVLKKTIERGSELGPTRLYLENLRLQIVPFDVLQAVSAAEIWHDCKGLGLSAADRACISLAMTRGGAIITADQRMGEVKLDVEIELIRKRH